MQKEAEIPAERARLLAILRNVFDRAEQEEIRNVARLRAEGWTDVMLQKGLDPGKDWPRWRWGIRAMLKESFRDRFPKPLTREEDFLIWRAEAQLLQAALTRAALQGDREVLDRAYRHKLYSALGL